MFKNLKLLPEVPEIMKPDYLPSLNGFRAVSIIMVVITHVFFDVESVLLNIFSGAFGVKVFFVISGFLITSLLLKEKIQHADISLQKFYWRRFLRIFPVAYLFLLVLLILNSILTLSIPSSGFISAMLYIRNLKLIEASDWYTGHYWSLSVEEQFYLFIPFLLKGTTVRIYVIVLVVLIAVIPITSYLYAHHVFNNPIFNTFSLILKNMSSILVGSLCAVLVFCGVIKENIGKVQNSIVAIFIFSLAAVIQSDAMAFIPDSISTTVAAILIAYLLLSFLQKDSKMTLFRLLNTRLMNTIGVLSYSLYIWQQIFTYNVPWSGMFPGSSSVVLNLFLLGVVSYCSYYYFERYFLRLKDRFRPGSSVKKDRQPSSMLTEPVEVRE